MVVSKIKFGFIECAADGNPQPSYKWYRKSSSAEADVEITSSVDARYTLTNGKLSIEDPSEKSDGGKYQCFAHNEMGVIMSEPVYVAFGCE